jgi:GT2 family glycosyltransferase
MLRRLTDHFKESRDLGLVGPVSNAAGNEQGIYTDAGSIEGVIQEGLAYANSGGSSLHAAYRLDFFCVAISKKVIEQAGLLDEGFGRGYFEDFDYSLRAVGAGFGLAVAEDAFVYHRGSASFAKMPAETRGLIRRNKQRVISKHGKDVVFPHARDGNLAILAQYAEARSRGETIPEIRCRNRLQYADSQMPRSWLKRWRYRNRLRRLRNALYPQRAS